MGFGNRLKAVRKHASLTQKEFAAKLNVTDISVINYEKGKRHPDTKFLELLEQTFSINLHWLLTGEGEMFITERKTVSTENVHIMPIEAEIAAGEPVEVTGERLKTYALDRALIPDVSNHFCFQVNGHSMEPGIEHQDLIIIKKDSCWQDKDRIVCAVRTDGEIALKRIIHAEEDKILYLISDNRNYPPIPVDPKHSDVILIGTLQMVIRNVG